MLPSPNIPCFPPDHSHDRTAISTGQEICLRTYHAKDRREILRLYRQGVLTGDPDPMDPATDLDHVEEVYLQRPQDHFWVAEIDGEVIGSIAILVNEKQIAHVRRLRVDPAWKKSHGEEIARALMEQATHHARRHDCLKLVLHTPVEDDRAIAFLHQMGFEYARARELRGRRLLEFYLDIYLPPDRRIIGNGRLG